MPLFVLPTPSPSARSIVCKLGAGSPDLSTACTRRLLGVDLQRREYLLCLVMGAGPIMVYVPTCMKGLSLAFYTDRQNAAEEGRNVVFWGRFSERVFPERV